MTLKTKKNITSMFITMEWVSLSVFAVEIIDIDDSCMMCQLSGFDHSDFILWHLWTLCLLPSTAERVGQDGADPLRWKTRRSGSASGGFWGNGQGHPRCQHPRQVNSPTLVDIKKYWFVSLRLVDRPISFRDVIFMVDWCKEPVIYLPIC